MSTGDDFQLPGDDTYLSDVSPQDKPWDKHRAHADQVKNLYWGTFFDCYALRIDSCSKFLEFFLVTRDDGALGLKLSNTFFCRVRHCPICQWRKQMKWRARFFKALPVLLAGNPKVRFLFLTLTVKNCPVNELRDCLAWMNKSWVRFTQRKQFPAMGWLKAVEVTRSTTGEAHPHFHAILMVNESYFKRGYLSKEKWVQLWRESLRVEYDPSVHIQVVKSKSHESNDLQSELSKGFCEVLKYSIKPDDLIADQDWLLEITGQLSKTRSVAVGGIFRKYMSDKEPEDLIGKDDDSDCDLDGIIWFGWKERVKRYRKVNKPGSSDGG